MAASWRRRTSAWHSFAIPASCAVRGKASKGKRKCTQISRDERKFRPNRHWRTSNPACVQACHLRASLLIRVHLRFHFLLPGQRRNQPRGTIVILGRSDPDRVQSIGLKNLTILCHDVTLFATGDRVLAAVWLRPRAALR
jgi:hypothetical protein